MDIETAVGLSLPVLFVTMMVLESRMSGGRDMPHIRRWRLIGLGALIVTLACNALSPLLIVPLLPDLVLIDLSRWGLGAAVPVLILTTFFTYWSHRLQHRYDWLWRLGHQFHHSALRVDIASSMIFHPFDILVGTVMTVLAAGLLKAGAEAAALAGALNFFIAPYQHWNVATPRWTGFVIQRPEAHMLHHQRDVHARNFGDLPVWDMVFGTFANPLRADVAVGFEPERSRRWLAMLAFVDVNAKAGRERL